MAKKAASEPKNEFDAYREALVVEQSTVWPDEFDHLAPAARRTLEPKLHAAPQQAAILAYHRQHSGFQREITVTQADLDRLG